MKSENRHPALDSKHRALQSQHRDEIPSTIVRWACRRVHLSNLSPHYLLIGTPGSGKTNLLKILMNSVLPDTEYGLRFRSLVYDPKTEFYPFLTRMGIPKEQIIVVNPFDARSSAWNLSRDFRAGGGHAEALAGAMIPIGAKVGGHESENFFEKAANQTLTDVIEGLMHRNPEGWELRDIVEVCADLKDIVAVLKVTPTGRNTLSRFFESDNPHSKLADDIMATLWSHIRKYISIASFWHNSETWFSVKDWHQGSGIILLGTDPEREEVMNTINQLLVRRMTQVIRRADEEPTDLTWCFFDELSGVTSGFPDFARFLREARSKGARVVLACQDLAGLREVFGRDQAESLMSVCDNKGFLHLASETATWASTVFGQTEQQVRTHSNGGQGKSSESWTRGLVTEVLPIEFMELPLAENHRGATRGFFHHPGEEGVFTDYLTSEDVDKLMPGRVEELPPTRLDREDDAHERVVWTDQDRERFGLRGGQNGKTVRFLKD